ncbi:hypothetical protein ACOSP7_001542 [Xanthoceras sorbifolium]|uniref:Uncharacterized protein n=1 Tax=Xanthoceras sorbifolium TaxID=99658 RepID=A0ABQ8ILF5_9ROSI|nr:hypothetical protein JRO89_XS01G0263300 [Xanthoceras sorbifolium]
MAGAEDIHGEVGFEEGMSWLPSHILREALFSVDTTTKRKAKHFHRPKLPAEPFLQQTKTSSRPHHRSKYQSNWAIKGSGMQAIFLDSGKRSCGTGVFLPQRVGTNFQPNKRPACSPVLLPSRVVQALNLDVHTIGLQISPRQDSKTNSKGGECNSTTKNKSGNGVSANRCVISQNQSSSPEIFLPKEWTY